MTRKLANFSIGNFSRGAPFWKEALWWLARDFFFAHGFPVPSWLKTTILCWFGARVGKGVVVRSRVNITFPWRFSCGNDVWIGDEVFILSLAEVRIGSNVCLSQRAFLCTGSHDYRKENFDLITKPIVVEDGCWIAARAFIGLGVTLRTNTVCGAGTVVFTDAGPDELVKGNPAERRKISQIG